ncbi:hypothetical protein [Siansivirga zeaxanthinifaciens]|uniref:Tetratricopeptide repeat protein n=1 Tax=Siansivirga zeaxanthinifaciens CC-SAMT-1 TaxID=1454006 RepID=A0A0C5WKN1_9FLAO|nr:hypothetical protein [Siansivirga zeaxanthinifaciens]AJR03345.1 hypothetical protein AW14_06430 [Siansivirga zeaxanthinifaciens CC-SAMT-1]
MNQTDFTYILQNPQAITQQQTEAIKSIIDEFPYFQPARALYLKSLKNQNSFKYNQELKTAAAHTTDRSILFDFITSEIFIQNEISNKIRHNTANLKDIEVDVEDISINKSVTIDDHLKQQIKDTTGVLDPALFEPKPSAETEEVEESPTENSNASSASEILNIGKPLIFEKNETHSFNEWLKLTRFQPINRSETASAKKEVEKVEKPTEFTETPETDNLEDAERSKKFELIDRFISINPRINPTKPVSLKGNLANAQMIQPEELMTETLARVYVEQKNYKKAIQSYKILSLKYPEKSSFFANQIKAVEELQEQNNNN